MTPLRVAVNARLHPGGGAGGIEQFVVSLIRALGRLDDGEVEYVVVGPPGEPDWLAPHLGPNQRLVAAPGGVAAAERVRRRLRRGPARDVAASGGFFEALGAAVVHFPYQAYARCRVPTLYNPHDLLHLHHPEFFAPEDLAYRRRAYRAACLLADAVACESRAVASDVAERYGVAPERLHVVLRGAPLEAPDPPPPGHLEQVQERLGLPETFALFPAQTWPHKNHVGLARALRLLLDRHGIAPTVICTGRQNDFFPTVEAEVRRLGQEERMRFVGYLPPADLRALYRLARFVVLPTLFEGGGFPVLEAFRDGTPVVCSDIPPLVEHAADAALYFDPRSEESMAAALLEVLGNDALVERLARAGAERGRAFDWARTARTYRALYRRLARAELGPGDEELLAASALS